MIKAALARLGALMTDLLPRGFFERMAAAGDVQRAREMLVGTVYDAAGRRAEGESVAQLEREMWVDVFDAWIRLAKFLEGAERDVVAWYARSFEVEDLRLTVRRVLSGGPRGSRAGLWDLRVLAALDLDRLARAHTVVDVREAVADGPYEHLFDLAEVRIAETEPLFAFEQVLDAGYLDVLLERARAVRGQDGRSAQAYIEQRIHITTLRWALRLRFGRGMPKEDVPQFLPRKESPDNRREIDAILACDSLGDAVSHVASLTGKESTSCTDVRECDRRLRAHLAAWARRQLRSEFARFASVFAYFDVRAQEVHDIAAAMVGLRQGRSEGEIRARLGLVA